MKRNYKFFFVLLVLFSSVLFCSFSRNNNKTIKGYIHVYGNDPFAFIGIETTDNKKYAISASEEEIAKLWKLQGNLIQITGIIIPSNNKKAPDMLEDGKIEVSEWKVIK